jgi:hypothetical protein
MAIRPYGLTDIWMDRGENGISPSVAKNLGGLEFLKLNTEKDHFGSWYLPKDGSSFEVVFWDTINAAGSKMMT